MVQDSKCIQLWLILVNKTSFCEGVCTVAATTVVIQRIHLCLKKWSWNKMTFFHCRCGKMSKPILTRLNFYFKMYRYIMLETMWSLRLLLEILFNMPMKMLNTNREALLCKMIYLCFSFVLQKGCLKLDPLLSLAATTNFAHLVSFPEDLTVQDNITPPPLPLKSAYITVYH